MAYSAADFKPNHKVKVTTNGECFVGIVIPQVGSSVILKLESGYNIGIKPSEITKMEDLGQVKRPTPSAQSVKQDASLPKITILHTGGTIASKVDYTTGGVIAQFEPSEIITMVPELSTVAQIDSRLISNMQTEFLRFSHLNVIANEIKKEADKGTDGIIVTLGTDFLHYASAALSFMLENLAIPVVCAGAQKSSDRGSSDAAINLLNAARFATTKTPGVYISMHANPDDTTGHILHGCKVRKMHTSRRDAFRPINDKPVATINSFDGNVTILQPNAFPKPKTKSKLSVTELNHDLKIGISYPHPHMWADEIKVYEKFDGVVLALSGIGHYPTHKVDETSEENSNIAETLKGMIKNNVSVVASAQPIYGRVNLNVYTPGRYLKSIGITGHLSDMTTETSYIKLAYLLSKAETDGAKDKKSRSQYVAKYFMENLRGELHDQSFMDEYLN